MNPPKLIIYCFAIAAFAALPAGAVTGAVDAPAAQKKTPAEWVAHLGAEHLAQRDEASVALLALGSQARDAVHGALDSKDPEIKSRARDLWKTLIWDVVPGAKKETAKIMADADGFYVSNYASAPGIHLDTHGDPPGKADDEDNNQQDDDQWRAFVKAHGPSALLLIVEMRAAGFSSRTYRAGVVNLLELVPAMDLVQFVASQGARQAALVSPLNVIVSGNIDQKGEAADVRIRAAVGDGQAAYDFARTMFFDSGGFYQEHLVAACADAVKQCGNFEMARTRALNDVKDETNVKMLALKMEFHIGVMAGLGRKDCIGELCDATAKTDLAMDSNWNWPLITLAKEVTAAGLPVRVLQILRNAKEPLLIYMRSHADMMLNNTAAADAEWKAVQKAADATDASKAKSSYFEIAELMNEWGDPRAVEIYRKVIAMPPFDHQDQTNAWFRLAQIAEDRKDYAAAADDYEKAMEAFKLVGGVWSTTDADGGVNVDGNTDGDAWMLSKIKELKAEAMSKKNGLGNAQAAGDGKSSPPKADKPPVP